MASRYALGLPCCVQSSSLWKIAERTSYSVDWLERSSPDSRSEGKSMVLFDVQRANRRCSYKLAAMKLVSPSKEHLEKHYEDLSDKPFYKGLVTCTPSLPTKLT